MKDLLNVAKLAKNWPIWSHCLTLSSWDCGWEGGGHKAPRH